MARSHYALVAAFIGLVLISAALVLSHVASTPAAAGTAVYTADGGARLQRMDGFGVNANPDNWKDGQLRPGLDMLVDTLNARIWRVEIDGFTRWEAVNDDADPFTFNWSYYNQVYETPQFQSLWSTVAYLNQKGVEVMLAGTGVVPDWMGGGVILPAQEDEFVEEIVSALYYARNTRGLQFRSISALNEPDLTGPEGPRVDATQYTRIMHKLADRLDAVGLSDVRLIVPETSGFDVRVVLPTFDDPVVMAKVDHIAVHSYQGTIGGAYDVVSFAGFPNLNVWVSEWSQTATDGSLRGGRVATDEWAFARTMADYLLNLLNGGASSALAWDGYETIHEHDGSGLYTGWGLLAYNRTTGIYTPKKRFYTSAQFFRFVPPGSYQISDNVNDATVKTCSFYDPATGKFTIVGRTAVGSPVTLAGTLTGIAPTTTLAYYYTNATADLARGANVGVVNSQFAVDIPADTIFTLTNVDLSTPTPVPSPTGTQTATSTPTVTPTATPAPPASAMTLTFDDSALLGQNHVLNGQYPAGVIDWGTNQWYLSGPWQQFTTRSIGFNGSVPRSGSFTLLSPRTLVAIDAYNGDTVNSTVTFSCPGNPLVTATIVARAAPVTLSTGWTTNCASVTVTSTNGWHTNFDNVVIAPAGVVVTPSPTATRTVTPTATATVTVTPTVSATATPTPTSPAITTLGNNRIGVTLDTGDSNNMNGSCIRTPAQAIAARSITVYVATLDSSTTNRSYQLAIYTDSSGRPGSLVAATATGTLTANAWNTLPISANLAPNTSYWLIYNTNGRSSTVNNMRYDSSPPGCGAYSAGAAPFGTWPASFGTAVLGPWSWSIYLNY